MKNPTNYLLIEALRKYHRYFGDDVQIECPMGGGVLMTLDQIAEDLCRRLCSISLLNEHGQRPVFSGQAHFQTDDWATSLMTLPQPSPDFIPPLLTQAAFQNAGSCDQCHRSTGFRVSGCQSRAEAGHHRLPGRAAVHRQR